MIYFPRLSEFDKIAVDTEGTGLYWYKDETYGIAVSAGIEDYYYDLRETPQAIDWLYDELKNYDGLIINHAMKFDAHALRQLGIDISRKKLRCTMVRAALIDENLFEYSLDAVCKIYLGEGKEEPYEWLADRFGGPATRKAQILNLQRAPIEVVSKYAKKDTRLALDLYEFQEEEIRKQNLYDICSLEDAVLPALIRMEARGIRIDVAKAEENLAMLGKEIEALQRDIDKEAGKPFNINSAPQIRELFKPEKIKGSKQYRLIDGTIAGYSGITGEPSIGKEILEQMTHPMASKITNLRAAIKIHGTFLRDQILGHQINGWIYANFKQCGTVNGRFSASDPALQAIPKRNQKMKLLTRSLFLPDEGDEMLRCDIEQSDFRGFVHYTESAPLLAAYAEDPWSDFHSIISKLLNIPRNPQAEGGANAKQINLGSIFGMGPGKLAKTMRLPYTEEVTEKGKVWLKPGYEAEEVFHIYHQNIPGVEAFNKKAAAVARTRGYVMSIHGRHLRFPNKNVVYKAPGYLYSSFTSELCKAAMVACDKIDGAKIKLQVHDELIFSIGNRDLIIPIREAMQTALGDRTRIPIRTNPEVGPTWYDCKKLEN